LRSFAVAVCLLFATLSVEGQGISTRCDEQEIALDGSRSVTRLEGCGDQASRNLLWYLDRIDSSGNLLDGRADRGNRGAGSVVYVMDTGVMASHSEFDRDGHSNVIAGFDVASVKAGTSRCRSTDKALDPCISDLNELTTSSHGTAVASIVGGRLTGVAPDASVVSIRVMNERGLATTKTYLDGLDAIIRHAFSPGAPRFHTAIVNISAWVLDRLPGEDGAVVSYAAVEAKMREMIAGVDASGHPDRAGRRFLFVVAANNIDGGCGPSGIVDRFPATLGAHIDGIVTVGGMTERNTAWSGGCRGGVDVLAPAQQILSASMTGPDEYRGPRQRSGTSFAAPIVSGLAARLLSARPDLTPQEVEMALRDTPSRIDHATPELADGRVACDRSTTASAAPARAVLSATRLESSR
jgi:subtilisin family serine protease